MSLTPADLQAIQGIVKSTVQPMIDEAVDTLAQSTAAGFAEVHERLAEVNGRLDGHDQQFAAVRSDLNRIENKLDVTIGQVDGHAVRLRALEPKAA